MAKTYNFTITLQQAEPSPIGGVAIVFGGYSSTYKTEPFEGTLAQVLEHRKAVSATEPRMHVAFVRMANRRDRKPPGFDKAVGDYIVGGTATAIAA